MFWLSVHGGSWQSVGVNIIYHGRVPHATMYWHLRSKTCRKLVWFIWKLLNDKRGMDFRDYALHIHFAVVWLIILHGSSNIIMEFCSELIVQIQFFVQDSKVSRFATQIFATLYWHYVFRLDKTQQCCISLSYRLAFRTILKQTVEEFQVRPDARAQYNYFLCVDGGPGNNGAVALYCFYIRQKFASSKSHAFYSTSVILPFSRFASQASQHTARSSTTTTGLTRQNMCAIMCNYSFINIFAT